MCRRAAIPVLDYQPVRSLHPLFQTMQPFWYAALGPLGSGKSLAMIMKLMQLAAGQAPGADGVRRSRGVITRVTLAQLKATVLRDIMDPKVLAPIAHYRSSDSLIQVRVGDIDAEWWLLPLETPQDQRRVLSMQLTYAWVNEAREVDFDTITALAGRVGRFPRMVDGGVSHPAVLLDTNPPSEASNLHDFLIKPWPDDPDGTKKKRDLLYIHQPSGLSADADWRQYLPADYYERLMTGQTPDWADVHVRSQFGYDRTGMSVFGSLFEQGTHVAGTTLLQMVRSMAQLPVIAGIDPGLNPGVALMQQMPNGQMMVFKEFASEGGLFRDFLTRDVMPWIDGNLPHHSIIGFMDPSGNVRSPMSTDTPYRIAKAMMNVKLAPTNDIKPRLAAMERRLMESRAEGARQVPALLVCPDGCPILIEGLARKYRYRRNRATGEIDIKPEKKHPVSDVVDACIYGLLGMGGRAVDPDRMLARRSYARPAPSPMAWT